MTARLRIIAGISGVLVLFVGFVGFFGLLVALNGYDEATGGRMLLGFLAIVALSIGLASWLTYQLTLRIGVRAGRSLWLVGPLSMLLSVIAAAVLQIIGAGALLIVFG